MSTPSPGWYPDPTTPGSLRFYDGEQWTKSVVTVPPNGQLTPEMIATGRRIMQDKASAKSAQGPITPRHLGAQNGDDRGTSSARSASSAHTGSTPVVGQTRSGLNRAASGAGAGTVAGAAMAGTNAVSATGAVSASGSASATGSAGIASAKSAASASAAPATRRAMFAPPAQADTTASTHESQLTDGAPTNGLQTEATPAVPGEPATATAQTPAVSAELPRWAKQDEQAQKTHAAFSNDTVGVASEVAGVDSEGSEVVSTESQPKFSKKKMAVIGGAALVVVVGVIGASLLFGGDSEPGKPSAAYEALGLKSDFGCAAVATEVKELSRSTDSEITVVSIKDITMTSDKRDVFELPTQSGKYVTAFECEGMATYDDGHTETLKFDMSADKSAKLWTYYPPRNK